VDERTPLVGYLAGLVLGFAGAAAGLPWWVCLGIVGLVVVAFNLWMHRAKA
jgi:hypothetical protein